MIRYTAIVIGTALLGGCGKGTTAPAMTTTVNMDTPKATADGLVKAFGERNVNLAVSLLPPPELLKANFDCPEDQVVKQVQAQRERSAKDIGAAPKDVTMDIATFDKLGTQDKQLRNGDPWQGCKAKGLIMVHDSKVDLRMTKDGKTDFDGETWTFLKFGDDPKWYYYR